ncbi:hypothetical protein G6F23_014068 [Rhizopus arrhizus]|nr:hypothetical protein G6F23_014068 [Rhizopus arrhizus]
MVVVHGQLAATVHIQRRADAVGVACCSQHAGHVATTAAVFLHPAQLGRQAIVLADPPFGSGLRRSHNRAARRPVRAPAGRYRSARPNSHRPPAATRHPRSSRAGSSPAHAG